MRPLMSLPLMIYYFLFVPLVSARTINLDSIVLGKHEHKSNNVDYATGIGMLFGQGYDSFTDDSAGRCVSVLQTSLDSRIRDNTIQQSVFKFELIESRQQLAQKLGVSISASLKSGWGKVNATANYLDEQKLDQYSLYVLITAHVLVPFETATNVTLMPELIDLARSNPTGFRKKCGNEFVATIHRGGNLYGLLRLETSSKSDQNQMRVALQGKVGTFKSAAVLSNQVNMLVQNRAFKIFVLQVGGSGNAYPNNLEDLLARINNFQQEVLNNPLPLMATTMPYEHLINYPADATAIDTSTQEDVLVYLNQQKNGLVKIRNDIDFILSSKFQFEAFDEKVMIEQIAKINTQLNKIISSAKKCLKNFDYCQFPDDLENISIEYPERLVIQIVDDKCKIRTRAEECGVIYKNFISPFCGVFQFNMKRAEVCGVEKYVTKTSPACNIAQYKQSSGAACGVELWNSQQNGNICGWDYDNTYCPKNLSTAREPREPIGRCITRKIAKTCRSPEFGVERYATCRHATFGVERFEACEDKSHGIETYKECRHESFGVESYASCRHVSNGVEGVKSCYLMEYIDEQTNLVSYRHCIPSKEE